ncbi:MAG: hypothetical protein ACYTGV_18125 [Planctomycetota bacterium]
MKREPAWTLPGSRGCQFDATCTRDGRRSRDDTLSEGLGPGQRVGNLWIERPLGRGAFGEVYLAQDTVIRRPVALKVLTVAGLELAVRDLFA